MYEAMYRELEEGENRLYQLSNVQFQTGSDELTKLSTYELENLVEFMKENEDLRIEIQGHTDDTGDTENNMALSQSRADRVAAFLQDAGISSERYTSVGYGASQPVDTNSTDAGRANNRRVQIEIL